MFRRPRSISIPVIPTLSPTPGTPIRRRRLSASSSPGSRSRRAAGIAPYTVMSCDNLPGNGHVTENAVVGLAEMSDPELAGWIRGATSPFPNGMVDRITPATTDRERAILNDQWGVEDNWPVFCEEFRQWVVEDTFTSGPPCARQGRRHFHKRRRALRIDEDQDSQRRARGDRLSRRAARHSFRPRGDGGRADRASSSQR